MWSIVLVSSSFRLVDLTAEHCSSLCTCLSRCPLKGDWSTLRDCTCISISDLESGRSQGTKATWPTLSIPAQQGRHGRHEVWDAVMLEWMPRGGGGTMQPKVTQAGAQLASKTVTAGGEMQVQQSPVQLNEKLMWQLDQGERGLVMGAFYHTVLTKLFLATLLISACKISCMGKWRQDGCVMMFGL